MTIEYLDLADYVAIAAAVTGVDDLRVGSDERPFSDRGRRLATFRRDPHFTSPTPSEMTQIARPPAALEMTPLMWVEVEGLGSPPRAVALR